MTCQEFQRLMEGSIGKGGPAAVTRAERTAMFRHMDGCPGCAAWFEVKHKAATEKLGPLLPLITALADSEARELVAEDRRDGEA